MKIQKLTTPEIELAVVNFLNSRINLIVPNISWGFGIHECDLLAVTKAGYLWEVEIKITASDLKADKNKHHGHKDDKLKRLYFAIPDYLEKYIKYIPYRAGIISVASQTYRHKCTLIKNPKENGNYKLTAEEKYRIAHLGAMRIWDLKRKLQKSIQASKLF